MMKSLSKMALQHLLDQGGRDQMYTTFMFSKDNQILLSFSLCVSTLLKKPDWTKMHSSFQWLKLDDRIKNLQSLKNIFLNLFKSIHQNFMYLDGTLKKVKEG